MIGAGPVPRSGLLGVLAAMFAVLFTAATLLAIAPPAAAQASDPAPLRFRDGAEEARFRALVSELRCVMCQNQSLADSNAQIAHDLRREVLDLMREGRSDAEVKRFLVARYGEFVLLRPRFKPGTILLWLAPLLLLGGAAAYLVRARRREPVSAGAPPPLSPEERKRLGDLLADERSET